MSKPKPGPSNKPATPPAAAQPSATQPADTTPPTDTTPAAKPEPKSKERVYAGGYQPTGTVRVLAKGAHVQVLEDDLRCWKEPL